MTDLLSSLILPNSSQESFHSAQADQPLTTPSPQINPVALNHHSSPQRIADLKIHDVNAYLSANQILLEKALTKKSPQFIAGKASDASSHSPNAADPVPTQIGAPESSLTLSKFYELCTSKGFTPIFTIDEDPKYAQTFTGKLDVGGATIVVEGEEGRWRSKKEAKQVLAARGCGAVANLEARVGRKEEDAVEENWIGKLLAMSTLMEGHFSLRPLPFHVMVEFYKPNPSITAPSFTFFALGTSFACECLIPQRPDAFGDRHVPYSSKKTAKSSAAKAAVEWLVNEGHLELDGTIKKRKKDKAGVVVQSDIASGKQIDYRSESSWAQKVNDLYPHLGLPPPAYRLSPTSSNTPNIFSGAAFFAQSPYDKGDIGEVRNVYGKKNAKDECARGVYEFLVRMVEKRGARVEAGRIVYRDEDEDGNERETGSGAGE